MITQIKDEREQDRRARDAHSAGIMAALKRAAIKAQRRAIETSGSYPIYKDGKIVYVTEVLGLEGDDSEGG